MRCLNEITIRNPKYELGSSEPKTLDVGCGKCYACLSNRRSEWAFRLLLQQRESKSVYFTTFTYAEIFDSDGCLVHDNRLGVVDKREMQLLLKRMRKILPGFKYYAIGEYGSLEGRPHYHSLFFFSYDVDWSSMYRAMLRSWSYGNVKLGDISNARINYILHYHVRPKVVDGRRTFQLFSKGLGKDFIEKNLKFYEKNQTTHLNGYPYQLPRYYRKKYGIEYNSDYVHKSLVEYLEEKGMNTDNLEGLLQGLREQYRQKQLRYNLQEKF